MDEEITRKDISDSIDEERKMAGIILHSRQNSRDINLTLDKRIIERNTEIKAESHSNTISTSGNYLIRVVQSTSLYVFTISEIKLNKNL